MSEASLPRVPTENSGSADAAVPKPEEIASFPRPPRSYDRIPRQFGRYRIMECLGRGGMGVVFKAQDGQLNRAVALKIPFLDSKDHEELRQRFFREARAAAALHHANICPVFDVGEFEGWPYLTMAFIDGRSLLKSLSTEPPFAPARIAMLVRKLALAMQEAHQHGVVHRDLKPANVILRLNGEPVIMDFGLARRADDSRSEGLTRQGEILGTVEYMSPEQVDGDNSALGPSTDIYSLGVIMYEMMCGRRPFDGSTASMLAAIMTKDPPKPTTVRPELPASLEAICLKAMAKKPADRYATMTQFAAALADFLRSFKPGSATSPAQKVEKPASPPKQPEAPTRPISHHDVDTDDGRRRPLSKEISRPKSSAKRQRSGRRRRAKRSSVVPLILGSGAALLAVAAVIAAVIIFLPRGDNKSAQSAPTSSQPSSVRNIGPGPAYTSSPSRPNTTTPVAPVVVPPTKAGAGFSLKFEPESVKLDVGQAQPITLKVTRTDYSGPIRLKIRGPRELKVSPGRDLSINPGQSELILTVRAMSALPKETERLEISAEPEAEAKRSGLAINLSVSVPVGGDCLRVVDLDPNPGFVVDSAAFLPDLSAALIAAGDVIHIWNLARGEPDGKLAGHHGRVTGLSIAADGRSALSVSADRTVAIWNLMTRKLDRQSADLKKRVLAAAMSPDGHRGLVVYVGSIVRVNLDTFQPIGYPINMSHLSGNNVDDAIQAVAVSSERKGLLGGAGGKLFLVDIPDKGRGSAPKPLPGHTDTVLCAAFAPNGRIAASAGNDKSVFVWDMTGHALKWKAVGHQQPVVCVAFSSDGRLIASGDVSGSVRVWNVADGKPVATFAGQTNPILSLAFAADGKSLWSAAGDKTLRQWRLP